MDETRNNYKNIDNQDVYSSIIPWANEFDFGEEADLSQIFDLPQEQQPVNTNTTSTESSSPKLHQNSVSGLELPSVVPEEEQPMTNNNIPSYSSTNNNSSRITYPITLDKDDDYSLSYVYSMGLNSVSMLQEEGGTSENSTMENTRNISRRGDQENPKTNRVLLQQSLPKIPILEKLEREVSLKSKFTQENPKSKDQHMPMKQTYHSSFGILEQEKLMVLNQGSDDFMKPKFFMNHPYEISTSKRAGEHENAKTNGMILQQPKSNILTLEKLESHLMKSKSMVDRENEIFKQRIDSGGYGILSSLNNNEFPQNTSTNIKRSPNRTSSRYQPYLGKEIDPNNQIEGKSDSSQVAEIGKQNGNNEEAFVNPSKDHNFPCSPAYTHEITNKFKGVASGQNFNQYTQGNEDGAPDHLQSSWAQSWNAQDSHFDTTTNWPWDPPFQ